MRRLTLLARITASIFLPDAALLQIKDPFKGQQRSYTTATIFACQHLVRKLIFLLIELVIFGNVCLNYEIVKQNQFSKN